MEFFQLELHGEVAHFKSERNAIQTRKTAVHVLQDGVKCFRGFVSEDEFGVRSGFVLVEELLPQHGGVHG